MDMLIALIGPVIFFWFLLAFPKAGRPFFIALGVFVAILAIYLLTDRTKTSGSHDDWYDAIAEAGFVFGLIAAAGPLVAQIWRYIRLRHDKPTDYPIALILCTVLVPVLGITLYDVF